MFSTTYFQENITHRWFRNHGFPMYFDCVEIFAKKKAAPVDFTGYPGYELSTPFYITDSEEEKDTCDEDDGEGGADQGTMFDEGLMTGNDNESV